MTTGKRGFVGVAVLTSAAPVFAQKAPMAASTPASQAEPDVHAPGDPTWLVAALIIGLIVGYLIGAWRSSARHRASHA